MIKTYKYKLNPTKQQADIFQTWLNNCRFTYNLCLEYKINLYCDRRISIGKFDMLKEYNEFKKDYPWLTKTHTHVLQNTIFRLYRTYDNFFRGEGFPKFATKKKFKSFEYKTAPTIHGKYVKLPKIGLVKFYKSREVDGNIKKCSIIKEYDGWYITLVVEKEINHLPSNDKQVGIDMGIKELMITSDGEMFQNPKTLNKYLKELQKAHRDLSRKKKGSNNRKKQIKKLNKIYGKIRNVRLDYRHKLTTQIVNDNQVIICEDLKVKNMVKNRKLSKAISDAGWRTILDMLEYKSEHYGRVFHKVNPRNTSKLCNACGTKNDELTLKIRNWVCSECGSEHERDINAAINILNKGLSELGHNFVTCGDMGKVTTPAQESHLL